MKTVAEPKKARILVVDDDEGARLGLEEILADDYEVVCAEDGMAALARIRRGAFDLVLLDLVMPGIDGIETLRQIKARQPSLEVIVVSATDRAREAVLALKLGACDYLAKPFRADALLKAVDATLERRAALPNAASHGQPPDLPGWGGIIGDSEGMRSVFGMVRRIAATSSNVLIHGESGTGKELIARAIHTHSPRAEKPFLAINCAAIPRELMESELFGHEKGAFTGAHRRSPGKLAHADGGTVFLDEISSLDIALQAKLLRFLQDQEVMPIGGLQATRIDVRIVAAANTRLEDLTRRGLFREDLFFRLNVLPVDLPPLRRRAGDVRLLARFFLKRTAARLNKPLTGFSPSALQTLESYHWPGNIRELENIVERLVVLGREGGEIDEKDLPTELAVCDRERALALSSGGAGGGLLQARRTFERHYIMLALKRSSWNQSEAARGLRIHRNTLIQKMRSLEISAP